MIKCESVYGNVFSFSPNQYINGSVFLWCWQINDENNGYRYTLCGYDKTVLKLNGVDETILKLNGINNNVHSICGGTK